MRNQHHWVNIRVQIVALETMINKQMAGATGGDTLDGELLIMAEDDVTREAKWVPMHVIQLRIFIVKLVRIN